MKNKERNTVDVNGQNTDEESGQTLEEKMLLLNNIIKQLESDDNTLEAAFKLYKEGMNYLYECNEAIDRVEKELIVLEGTENGI